MRAEPRATGSGRESPLPQPRGLGAGSGPIRRNLGRTLALLMGPAFTLSALDHASALTLPDDLCTGDPCVISSDHNIDSGSIIDFGARDVILEARLDVGSGSMTLRAASFTVQGSGQIRGKGGAGAPGGVVVIETTSGITLSGTPLGGSVNLSGADAGSIVLRATAGSVTGLGQINLDNSISSASGGDLSIIAGGTVNLSGDLNLQGGSLGGGGSVDIVATGAVSLSGTVDLSGGDSGGGFMDLSAGSSVTLGPINADGSGDGGPGGSLDILSGDSITLLGAFSARGASGLDRCGDGGELDLTAIGDISIQGDIDQNGPGACCGGFALMSGENVQLENPIQLRGTSAEGCGGDLEVSARGLLSSTSSILLDGGEEGGALALLAGGDLDVQGPIDGRGRAPFASGANLLELDAGGHLTLSNDVDASGGADGFGGDALLVGCEVTVDPGVSLLANELFGSISVLAHNAMTLAGVYSAGPIAGSIDLIFGPQADPPDIAAATFNIPPSLIPDPLLTPCLPCTGDAECNDGNLCTDDSCSLTGRCTNPPNTSPCEDGNACTTPDFCSFGTCLSGPPRDCSDGKSCTADTCDPLSGCENPPIPGPCEDGNACTEGDLCSAGVCVSGSALECDDGNSCTDDTCDVALGCIQTPNSASCDDVDACTTGDICSDSSCVGTPLDCDDGDVCTTDSCTAGVCGYVQNSAPCDDGDACATGDVCSNGVCVASGTLDCDDADVCTDDSCDSIEGCGHQTIPGCVDTDGDQKRDEQDECTTIDWSPTPTTPPDQHPVAFGLSLRNLASPGRHQVKAKGFFNPAPSAPQMDPATQGIHLRISDEGGLLYDVSIPGGAVGTSPCGERDGWKADLRPGRAKWKYRNKSGAVPPGCESGSARGISSLQIKDRRSSSKGGYQFRVAAKETTLPGTPSLPVRRIQFDLALAAEPSAGQASAEAITGLCAEALILGDPVPERGTKPRCKVRLAGPITDRVDCKGP